MLAFISYELCCVELSEGHRTVSIRDALAVDYRFAIYSAVDAQYE
jgi:hypothetical protein